MAGCFIIIIGYLGVINGVQVGLIEVLIHIYANTRESCRSVVGKKNLLHYIYVIDVLVI